MSLPPHRRKKDDGDFSDIWDTNRGQGKMDKSRIWGTDEYFRRIEQPRDEWDTGLEDYPGMTRRIKSQIDAEADRLKRQIKIDTERIKEDARKAAENVRKNVSMARTEALKEVVRNYDFTPTPRIKKTKRRFKLSSKSGGIGIFGIIFWGLIFFNMCDGEEKTAKVIDTSSKTEVSEVFDKAREYSNQAITKVEEGFKELDKQEKKPKNTGNVDDPYKQPDDRYGSIDDKW